jgi:hypothetical protein
MVPNLEETAYRGLAKRKGAPQDLQRLEQMHTKSCGLTRMWPNAENVYYTQEPSKKLRLVCLSLEKTFAGFPTSQFLPRPSGSFLVQQRPLIVREIEWMLHFIG